MELLRHLRLPTASLPTKLMVALSIVVIAVVAGSATLLVERERGERLRRLEERATRIADLLEQSVAQQLWNADGKAIQRQLDALSPNREVAEVTVSASGYGTVATVGPRPISDATGAVVRVRPITYRQLEALPPQTIGEVRVVLSRAEAEAAFARARWAILGMAAAVALTLCAATSLLVKRLVRTPISRLETMVDRLAAGDLDARCPVDSADELGRLAERVNVMADRLRESTAGVHESEIRFRTFVDHAADAFFLHDDQLIVVDVNRQACESLGYGREELIGMHPRDFDVGLDEASVTRLAERVRAGETVTFESVHRRKDGTVFPVEVRAHRFPQGQHQFRYSLVRDITERKRAEAELQTSEERFRTLVQFSFDVYWETDAQHRFTRQEYSEQLADAPAPGTEIGKTRWEVPYLEPDDEAWRKHRATLDAHLPFRDFELARPTPDGGKRWVSVSGLPMFDSTGRFLGYRGVGRHITERKHAEAELRARQELLDLAQQAARAVAFDWYIGARESENRWSPELEAMYGLEPGAFDRTYQGWKKLIHPDDWPAVKAAINRANESGDVAAEYRVVHKDGTVHWLRARGRMFFDGKGQPERMVGFMIDVTDWRHAEEALRASEARFRMFVDHATDGFFRLDDSSRVIDVNRQACESLGYSREELIGMHPRDFDAGLDASSLARIIERISAGNTVTFETLHRRKDGRVFPVEIRARQFEQGGRRFRLSLARDISDRRRAEEERREHLWFLESMDRINRAMQGTNDLERMMSDVLDAVLDVFACDRAWLIHPCDPDARSWSPAMERTRPEFPGAFAAGTEFPVDRDIAALFAAARASDSVVHFGRRSGTNVPEVADRFTIRSQIAIAVDPKVDRPYLFGIQQCARDRIWTAVEERLFQEIGRRLADALTSLLVIRTLRDSERKLEAAQRLARVGWWERDFTTNRVALSTEVCRIFGIEPVDLPLWHERWLSVIHPDDRGRAGAAAAASLRGDARYDIEYRVLRPDGMERVVHSVGDVTRNSSGQPVRQFGMLQDITELRKAENELRASEARFRTFVEHAADAFLLHDERGTVVDANRQACESLGYSRDELIGMDPSQFSVDLDSRLRRRIAAGEVVNFETRHRRKDGAVFPVEVRIRPIQQHGLPRFLSFVRDISERKRAEQHRLMQHTVAQALSEAETIDEATPKILQAVCERLDWDLGTLWRIDGEAGVLRCAQIWRRPSIELPQFEAATHASTFGPGSGLPGRVWSSRTPACIPDVAREPSFLRADDAARGGLHAAFAFPILVGGEVVGVIDFMSREVRAPDPDLLAVMASIGSQIGQFIERKRAERALEHAEAELAHVARVTTLGELAASIAHEVNQPLAGVVSNASACLRWLGRDVPNLEEAREAATRIVRDGKRAGEVIARVRSLTRKAPTSREQLDVNQTIRDVLALVGDEAKRTDTIIRTRFGADVAPVAGDRVQLQQVVLNLVKNGIEAMTAVTERTRELVITTRNVAPEQVQVTVEDSGIGLDPNAMDKVFEPFYTTKATGMGMGLSICRSIVKNHGGRIWATAKNSPGTMFHFALPNCREQEPNARAE